MLLFRKRDASGVTVAMYFFSAAFVNEMICCFNTGLSQAMAGPHCAVARYGLIIPFIVTIMNIFRPVSAFVACAFLLPACQSTPPVEPDRFVIADANKNGTLNGGEVSNYFVANIFSERDTNKDGSITKAEWNPEMSAAETKEFAARDMNRDAGITLAEAEAYALKAGTYTGVVKEADSSKDGVISREEAKAYYASKEGPLR